MGAGMLPILDGGTEIGIQGYMEGIYEGARKMNIWTITEWSLKSEIIIRIKS